MVTLEHMRFSDLCTDVSRELFLNVLRSHHCLNHLLPAYRPLAALCLRGHNFVLPECLISLHKRSFIVSCLYEFVWYFHTMLFFPFYILIIHFTCCIFRDCYHYCSVFCCIPVVCCFLYLLQFYRRHLTVVVPSQSADIHFTCAAFPAGSRWNAANLTLWWNWRRSAQCVTIQASITTRLVLSIYTTVKIGGWYW